MELRRSGFLDDDGTSSNLSNNRGIKQHPLSTMSSNSYVPRFGGIAGGMLAELQECSEDHPSPEQELMGTGQPLKQ